MLENTKTAQVSEQKTVSEQIPVVMPLVDIEETETQYLVRVDIPGVNPEDINVQLDKDSLVVDALSNIEGLSKMHYQRNFRVLRGLDPEKVQAEYKLGVLTLSLPKPNSQKPQKIKICSE